MVMAASLRNSGRTGLGISEVINSSTAAAAPLVMKMNKRGRSRAALAKSLRSLFEALEDRTLFSTLPAPTQLNPGVLVTDPAAVPTINFNSPSVAYDPLVPTTL